MSIVRIAVDAMGGDNAPQAPVEGAVQALRASAANQLEVVLVGDQKAIDAEMGRLGVDRSEIAVAHAPDRVEVGESTTEAIKKHRRSSISVALDLHRDGDVQGVVSSGHTGVQTALSVLRLGRLEGVRRPTIGAFFPNKEGETLLLDVGANADCKPYHLVQFAAMGSIFVSHHKHIDNPRIGLLSIGEEKSKGNLLTKQTHELFAVCPFDFIGNVEGRDIMSGRADVIVCDGYVGNILLKFAESMQLVINGHMKSFTSDSVEENQSRLYYESLDKIFDYQERGGVPLLGIDGVSYICHGSSSPKAICNAILGAKKMVEDEVVGKIQHAIEEYHVGLFTRGMVKLKDWPRVREWRKKMELRDLERK
jgi:glycerol-3-phosphate acyltransferase PlsX